MISGNNQQIVQAVGRLCFMSFVMICLCGLYVLSQLAIEYGEPLMLNILMRYRIDGFSNLDAVLLDSHSFNIEISKILLILIMIYLTGFKD